MFGGNYTIQMILLSSICVNLFPTKSYSERRGFRQKSRKEFCLVMFIAILKYQRVSRETLLTFHFFQEYYGFERRHWSDIERRCWKARFLESNQKNANIKPFLGEWNKKNTFSALSIVFGADLQTKVIDLCSVLRRRASTILQSAANDKKKRWEN